MNLRKNIFWIALSQSSKIISQLANMFILARILSPSDYGVMAIAGVAINFALLIRDMGTASNIIQRKIIDHDIINAVFWLNVLLGLFIAAVLVISAPMIAQVFLTDILVSVLSLIALTFPLSSSSAIHQALLERESRFKVVAAIEGLAAFLSITASILAAVLGFGVYSLVLQIVVQVGTVTLSLWLCSSWRPSFDIKLYRLKEIYHFSGNMAGYQMVSFVFRNADSIIIGKFLSNAALGMYSMAYKIMLFPIQNISWITTRAIFPLLSRSQDNLPEMSRLYIAAVRGVSFFTAPLMVILFITRNDFIGLFLGNKWQTIADLLIFMTPIGYLQSISGTTGPVFMALGKTHFLFKFGAFGALLHVVFYMVGAQYGVEELTIFYLVACFIVTGLTFKFAHDFIQLSNRKFFECLFPSITASCISGILTTFLYHQTLEMSILIRFLIEIITFSIFYLLLILIMRPKDLEFIWKQKSP